MRVNDLARFIIERECVHIRKAQGKPRPWTRDSILDKYRFCNVRREDDRVTRWLRNIWYLHFAGDPDIWFAAVVARLLNNPESLNYVMSYVLPWKPNSFQRALDERKARGLKVFNAAYIVSTNGVAMEKVAYLVERVLKPLWASRTIMRPRANWTLEAYHRKLMDFDGLGSFIAAQVVADLKYLPPLSKAPDWQTFAASGPGSRRGMNRILELPADTSCPESHWRRRLRELTDKLNPLLTKSDLFSQGLHAQDVQNCLCEFDKYERARLGEGTPKQIYKERV